MDRALSLCMHHMLAMPFIQCLAHTWNPEQRWNFVRPGRDDEFQAELDAKPEEPTLVQERDAGKEKKRVECTTQASVLFHSNTQM